MKPKIIIFGASLKGRAAFDITKYIGVYDVYAFADNDTKKQKGLFMGLPVLSAKEAIEAGMPILLASMFKYEIIEQLNKMGFSNYFFSYRDKGIELLDSQVKELEQIVNYAYYYNTYELLYDFEIPESHSKKPVEKDKIVFCCDTVYQFLTSYLLRKLYFKDKNCVLLAGNRLESLNSILNEMPDGIFNKVVRFNYNYNITRAEFNEIVNIFGVPEKFIFYGDYFKLVLKLIRILPENTRLIMADEGLYSYAGLVKAQNDNRFFDTVKVDELWIYNKSMFTPPKDGIPVYEITYDINSIKQHIGELNRLFGYTYRRLTHKIIYFDEAIKGYISAEYEKRFFDAISDVLKKKDSIIKPHPSEKYEKYSSSPVPLVGGSLEASRFPWELYELNSLINGDYGADIYVSLCSTAVLFDYTFASISGKRRSKKIIYVYKLLDIIAKEHILYNNIRNFEEFLPIISDENIFVPETFEELETLLCQS